MLTKIFSIIRSILCPFKEIEKFVPKSGKILDLGCGHGILSANIAQRSLQRKVIGLDPSQNKIKNAIYSYGKLKNLYFKEGFLENLTENNFNCVLMIDVMYLLNNREKNKYLKIIYNILKNDGLFILNNTSLSPSWLFNISKIEEFLMVKILRYTYSNQQQLAWLSKDQYKKRLLKAGFKIKGYQLLKGFPYRHDLIIAQK